MAEMFTRIMSELNAQQEKHAGAPGPASLHPDLLPYQKEDVAAVMRMGGRALLSHEMGLGKTVITLALCKQYRDDWPVLVVAPPVLLTQWADEIDKWLGADFPVVEATPKGSKRAGKGKGGPIQIVTKGSDTVRSDALFVLVSYGTLTGQRDKKTGEQTNRQLRVRADGSPWAFIVADEAVALKTHSSKRSGLVCELLRSSRRALLLTGTPMPNGCAAELYPLVASVCPAIARIDHDSEWCGRFCEWRVMLLPGGGQVRSPVGAHRPHELKQILDRVQVRRRKEEVASQLPPKVRRVVRLALEPKEYAPVRALMEQSREALLANDGTPSVEGMQAFRALAEAKGKAVVDWLDATVFGAAKADLSAGKLLIFAHHHALHDVLAGALAHKERCGPSGFARVTGKTPAAEREAAVLRLREDPACLVGLLSLQACGAGLNLAVADRVVFAELCWAPADLEQAEARAHRIGQAHAQVTCYYLLACPAGARNPQAPSPDEIMFDTLQNKATTIDLVVDGGAVDAASTMRGAQHEPAPPRSAKRDRAGEPKAEPPAQPAASAASPGRAKLVSAGELAAAGESVPAELGELRDGKVSPGKVAPLPATPPRRSGTSIKEEDIAADHGVAAASFTTPCRPSAEPRGAGSSSTVKPPI